MDEWRLQHRYPATHDHCCGLTGSFYTLSDNLLVLSPIEVNLSWGLPGQTDIRAFMWSSVLCFHYPCKCQLLKIYRERKVKSKHPGIISPEVIKTLFQQLADIHNCALQQDIEGVDAVQVALVVCSSYFLCSWSNCCSTNMKRNP